VIKFDIPEKPVDGFTLKYWALSWSEVWCYIRELKAVYYVNTPWIIYSPNSGGGTDLIDDWMISEKSDKGNWNGIGRNCGWVNINRTPEYALNYFPTKEEAIVEAEKRYDSAITRSLDRIFLMERLRESLR
jgi:hypothetical protein